MGLIGNFQAGHDMRNGFSLRLRIFVLGLALVVSAFAVQFLGERLGVQRQAGLWVWAAIAVALIAVVLGPVLLRQTSSSRALLAFALLLLAGAAVYGYVAYVMLPNALVDHVKPVPRKP